MVVLVMVGGGGIGDGWSDGIGDGWGGGISDG